MDVTKYSVVDPRIVQHKAKYAVEKGALSITNQVFSAIANSSSQQTFQVQVPSENVFVDRAIDWVNTACLEVTVVYSVVASGAVLATPGVNFSLAPFPVTQTVSTMTATINDQTVTVNTSDVLPQILRLADLAKTRMQRTCPTMLDKYYSVQNASNVPNSPIGAWGAAYDSTNVPCGAWGQLSFYAITNVTMVSGLPTVTASAGGTGAATCVFGVQFTTAEKLVLPPFIFSDEDELSTGLFGVQNIQFTANFNVPTRAVRMTAVAPSGTYSALPSVAWATTGPAGPLQTPFVKAALQVQFLTPSLDIPLPAKSICQWMEFPRYISPSGTLGTSALESLQSQTITLPSIPDLLVIYVKPQSYTDCTQCDWSLPISQISLNFDNFSGLLANHSQYELYKMSVNNGLDMDFDEWSGSAWVNGSAAASKNGAGLTSLVGGPLVLRPGRDFALQTGQAPGLVGNFTLQYNMQVDNSAARTGASVSIYTITVNSGFFETIKGSSRILKGVVTEQDILAAPIAAVEQSLDRMVGEGKHHHMSHGSTHHHMSHGSTHHKHGIHKYLRG